MRTMPVEKDAQELRGSLAMAEEITLTHVEDEGEEDLLFVSIFA